jgi:hypothetical protein
MHGYHRVVPLALEAGMRWLFQETYNEAETAKRKKGFVGRYREGRGKFRNHGIR